jgi:Sulfotransferase family
MTDAPLDPGQGMMTLTPLQRPLFVLSVWRSGSSLLYTLLNQHSKIGLLYEGELPQLQLFLWGRFRSGKWRERWEFWNQGPSRHGIAIESMPTNVTNAWEATRIVYQQVARRKQATIWGEKTPHWYDRTLRLAAKFPDARFIFLWRDMNAVMESIARAALTDRFFRKAGLSIRALLGNEKLRQACDALEAQGRRVHEVNYEDLTANTSESMQQICHFLEIPFESQITSLAGADRSAILLGPHHAMVRGDRIVERRKQAEILSPMMRAKVGRYNCLWKRRYEGKWPKYPLEVPDSTRPPGLVELWRDLMIYRSVRCRDMMITVIYAIMPVGLARGLRHWSQQRSYKRGLLPASQ